MITLAHFANFYNSNKIFICFRKMILTDMFSFIIVSIFFLSKYYNTCKGLQMCTI